MSSEENTAALNKYLNLTADNAIDLTGPVFYDRVESTELPDVESLTVFSSQPKPRVVNEGGISLEKKKRKSGEVKPKSGIDWHNHDHQLSLRAEEIWKGIKKRPTSGKMIDKQMEFATKLAQFEQVNDELEVAKMDAGAEYLKVKPADWLRTPSERPSYTHIYEDKNAGQKSTAVSEQMAKITKLSECMKYMNIEIHPHTLRAWYLATLEGEAGARGLRVRPAGALCAGAVAITRTVPRELRAEQQTLALSSPRQDCLRFLYIQCASETGELLARGRLTRHLGARRRLLAGQLTLLVLDTENYFKKGKPQIELEAAIVDLLVAVEIDTLVMSSAEELVSTILQFTRAVAEEPAKLAKRAVDEEAEFYMRGDNKNCVTVDQKGNGLSRAWQQMLSALPLASLEAARALRSRHTTPRSLAEGVSTDEDVARLGDLGVIRSKAPGAKPRRLGSEMAKKLKVLFTSLDGELVVE